MTDAGGIFAHKKRTLPKHAKGLTLRGKGLKLSYILLHARGEYGRKAET